MSEILRGKSLAAGRAALINVARPPQWKRQGLSMIATSRFFRLCTVSVLAGAALGVVSLSHADDGTGARPSPTPALRIAFREGGDNALEVKAGTFTTAKLGRMIVTADKAAI